MKQVALWILTAVVFTLGGALAGQLLDQALWIISYDYVYRTAQFASGGVRLGLLLGCVTAAAATAGGRPPARAVAVLRLAVLTLAAAAVCGVALGGAAAAVSRVRDNQADSRSLAPRNRIWFCEWLWRGSAGGAVCAAAIGNYRLIRHRAPNRRNA
ncbi:MAG: hypothetical protein HY290_11730 [Planctomycetia bacterium]|nr:hypothetical protein [Planctomycetia bacterium]